MSLLNPRKERKFKLKPIKKCPPKTKLGKRIKDPFGNIKLLKRVVIGLIGLVTYRRLNMVNTMNVEGMDYLKDLPTNNVFFVSNHQTYFAEVFALNHIFCSDKWGFNNINLPIYLLAPRTKSYYIAAEETMNGGIVPKIFAYAGAITVKRSWRHQGKDVKRGADFRAPAKIKKALDDGWVINFPQGTTSPNAPIQRGTANLIKSFDPIVVPVEVNGFGEAFDKKGLKFKERGVQLSVKFGKPIQFGVTATKDDIFQFLEREILKKN